MDYSVVVHVLKSNYDVCHEKLSLCLSKMLDFHLVVAQIAAHDEIGDQI